jgi:acyl carrier protein
VLYVVGVLAEPMDDVRDFLRRNVAGHMVPAEVIRLESIPHTISGKVDRNALPAPSGGRRPDGTYTAPRTPLERHIAGLAGEVLDLDRVGAADDFFELGGNSLQAARFVNRIRENFGVDISLQSFFAAPTVAATATATENARRDLRYEERLARIERDLARLSDDEVRALLDQQRAGPTGTTGATPTREP